MTTQATPDGLEFRSFREEDLGRVLSLFLDVFGKEMDETFYRWRFLDNPFGPAMVLLALDGDRLASHYAVCPALSLIEGKPVLTAQSMTTMTHPDYGGRGLFPAMARALYDQIHGAHGVRAVFGFPNPNSHYAFGAKLGWRDLFPLFFLERPVAEEDEGPWRHVDREEQRSLVESAAPAAGCLPYRRDGTFLEWRYHRNPVCRYEFLAAEDSEDPCCCVVKERTVEGGVMMDVVDFLGSTERAAVDEALRAVHARARALSAERVSGWLDLRHPAFPAMERMRYRPAGPITYFGIKPLATLPDCAADPRSWRVTMGDSDVF
jgi:hypothetical protein